MSGRTILTDAISSRHRSDLDLLPATLPESQPHQHSSGEDVEHGGHPRPRHSQPEGYGKQVGRDQAHDPRGTRHHQEYSPRIRGAAQPPAEAKADSQPGHTDAECEK